MSNSALDFGVQSFCFRAFDDNAQIARKVRELDLHKIELCDRHADFSDPEGFRKTVKTYADEGVQIVSIGVQTFTGDAQTERKWFECAAAAGARHISAHFKVDTYQQAVPAAVRLCEEYGIRLALHCHGGYMFGGSPDVVEHLLELGGPSLGLNLDTAWCMQIGPRHGDPVAWAERFKDRLYGLHYKDFVFDRSAQWQDVIVGSGNLDLPALVQTVQRNGFDGFAVLEYEGDVDNPLPSLKQCVQAMRATMAQVA